MWGAGLLPETKAGRELYELGPFRVDAEREVLLRAGTPVPLAPKAFQVLLVLIRHNQQVVTKDDLLTEVWPGTFVEEANLSRNIFLLRKALGESPQDHRYVLTVPGRGYRLAENVRLVPEQAMSIVAATHSKIQVQTKESNRLLMIVLVAMCLVAAAALAFWLQLHRKPTLSEKDTVVLSDFANSTGDSVFDASLRQGLSVQLKQSPYLSLVSDEKIQQTLQLMRQPAAVQLTPQIARDVCQRNGAAAVLEGSISPLGNEYVVGLRATNCLTGEVLDEEQAQASKKEDVLNILSEIARKFRTKVGESLATIQNHNIPLAEATTPSLEALRAYSLGWKSTFGASGPAEALPFFKRAIEIDPNFASAYAMLGRIYADLGESSLASENLTKAYELRDRTSDPERFFIVFNYEMQVTGNLEKARQAGELWAQTYPRDKGPLGLLSFLYQELGNYDRSIQAGKAAVNLDPDFVPGYANLAWAYVLSDRLKEAEETVRLVSTRNLEFPDLYILLYDIAFLRGDSAGMEHAVGLAQGKSGGEHWIDARRACVLAYSGHVRDARTVTRRAVQLAEQSGQPERAALYLAGAATREALFGNSADARRSALAALSLSSDRDVEYGAAFALARIGEEARVTAIMDDLKNRYPNDTFVKFSYLPTLRAILSIHQNVPRAAIEGLEAELPYDMGIAGSWPGFFGDMYPIFVRGEAYLALHQGREAVTEFQKIVSHRGIVASDPVGALAYLQLARAYRMAGDPRLERSSYDQFSRLWKDADNDTPVFVQARTEIATTH